MFALLALMLISIPTAIIEWFGEKVEEKREHDFCKEACRIRAERYN